MKTMGNAYIYLLKKRYGAKWKDFRHKLDYYLDFSFIYVIFLGLFFFLYYRSLWISPPELFTYMAVFTGSISPLLMLYIGGMLLLQYFIKGLTQSPLHYEIGDTYFLFSLPIPKLQYLSFKWFALQGKFLLLLLLSFVFTAQIFHILWPTAWLSKGVDIYLKIGLLSILLINIQWISFNLPEQIKGFLLSFIKYLKILTLILLGVSLVSLFIFFYFFQGTFMDVSTLPKVPPMDGRNLSISSSILFIDAVLSIGVAFILMKTIPLEKLKNTSLQYHKIKSFRLLGMQSQANNLLKGKRKKEKKYFLSIPGFFKDATIFLWRNLSLFIKNPLSSLFQYGLYLFIAGGIIVFTKGSPIVSLIFIFFILYVLGQNMLSLLREDYFANHFLSSFPIKSIFIIRGYLLFPTLLSTLVGVLLLFLLGNILGTFKILFLSIVLPFFTYHILLTSTKNVLEDLNLVLSVNKNLVLEMIFLGQGIIPILLASFLFQKGIPLILILVGLLLLYLFLIVTLEKDVVGSFKAVFNKYE